MVNGKNLNLAYSSAMHFLVDGICASCLFLLADILIDGNAGVAFVTYNVVAFMTQPLTGWLADRLWPKADTLLRASLAFLAIGTLLSAATAAVPFLATSSVTPLLAMSASSVSLLSSAPAAPLPLLATLSVSVPSGFAARVAPTAFLAIAVIIGAGNSLFHVWGGKRTAVESGNDIRSLGIFVSTGSLGLTIGILFHSWWLLAILLLAYVGCVRPHPRPLSQGEGSGHLSDASQPLAPQQVYTPLSLGEGPGVRPVGVRPVWVRPFLLALMLIVLFRSYYGETFTWGFDKDMALTLAITLCAMTGKATGGWLVRGLGLWAACVLILVGIVACAWFRTSNVGIMLAGIYLINTTMPITLWLANRLLPGREGLAFGLLAAVLVPGYLLAVTL